MGEPGSLACLATFALATTGAANARSRTANRCQRVAVRRVMDDRMQRLRATAICSSLAASLATFQPLGLEAAALDAAVLELELVAALGAGAREVLQRDPAALRRFAGVGPRAAHGVARLHALQLEGARAGQRRLGQVAVKREEQARVVLARVCDLGQRDLKRRAVRGAAGVTDGGEGPGGRR